MRNNSPLRVFALNASGEFGGNVAAALDIPLSEHEEREFEDGEHKIRPLENVRGTDVFVIHSLVSDDTQSVNDKLVRFLFMLGAVRDAAAARVTAVAPYLCYMRKDRKTQPRDPLSSRYVAQLFEAVGVDRVITLDVHNLAAYQNAFRCGTEHLEAKNTFVKFIMPMLHTPQVAVASPDAQVASSEPNCFAKRWKNNCKIRCHPHTWKNSAAAAWSAETRWSVMWRAKPS
jgi:ribose-phosphate pyrophosphokinase